MIVKVNRSTDEVIDINSSIPAELQNFFNAIEDTLPKPPKTYKNEFKPVVYTATPEATAYWTDWQKENDKRIDNETEIIIADHFAKYPSLFCALSLVFMFIRSGDVVEVEDMEIASKWCGYLALHAIALYSSGASKITDKFIEKMKSGVITDGMSLRELNQKKVLGRNTRKVIVNVLQVLVKQGYIRVKDAEKGSKIIEINPNFEVSNND